MKNKLELGIFYSNSPILLSSDIYYEDNGKVFCKIGAGRGSRYKEIGKLTMFSQCFKFVIRIVDGCPCIEQDLGFK